MQCGSIRTSRESPRGGSRPPGSRPCNTACGTTGTTSPPGTGRTAAPRGGAGCARRRAIGARLVHSSHRVGFPGPGPASSGPGRTPDPGTSRAGPSAAAAAPAAGAATRRTGSQHRPDLRVTPAELTHRLAGDAHDFDVIERRHRRRSPPGLVARTATAGQPAGRRTTARSRRSSRPAQGGRGRGARPAAVRATFTDRADSVKFAAENALVVEPDRVPLADDRFAGSTRTSGDRPQLTQDRFTLFAGQPGEELAAAQARSMARPR